ncbi:unnamed protein product [Dibothriocephalus latus]|uniref:Uncharacterized protein n=1 Tax=Dibothriocephalus latus TaxID=60516 RepID=A0A3P7L097_DIBLA|nr:unnamed protein product [Dibothriocephalus latus]
MTENTNGNGSVPCIIQEVRFGGPKYVDFLRYNRLIVLSILGLPVGVAGLIKSGPSICLFCCDKKAPRTTQNLKPESSGVTEGLYQLHSFTDSILVTLIPLIVLIVCSLQIRRGLRRSDRFRLGPREYPERQTVSTSGHKINYRPNCNIIRRVKLTRGLLIAIVTFTRFMLPMVPVSIVQLLSPHFFTSNGAYLITI